MGQDASGVLEQLNKDMILSCPSCKKLYNLNSRAPVMVCPNQHNYCEECLEEVIKAKKCFQCKETLLLKRRRNTLLCYIIEKLLLDSQTEKAMQKPVKMQENRSIPALKRYESAQITQFKTFDSPERKIIKIKSVKQQSIPNLNLELYKQQREFRKKYSVASIFSATKVEGDSPKKSEEETFQDILAKIADEHQITPFKTLIAEKTDPMTVKNLDLHLYKIPKIFSLFSNFKQLMRLNLTKNRITKIENLGELKQLNYLSLSENQIEFIQNLEELTNLKNLYLNRNRIERIQNLEKLISLEFLGLGFNSIQKIENISGLSELKWLNLECNYISKIEGIMTLKKLQIILLGSNEIVVFQGFEEFPALQEIHIQNNKITNLGKALSMKHLRKIRLEDNPGLKEENSEEYLKLLEVIEAKSKGIEKPQEACSIY